MALLGRWARTHGARRHEAAHEAAVGGGMFDGLKQIFADPFMRNMALLLLLADCIGTINYALVIDYSGMTFTDAIARTRFAANLDLATNLLQVILQLTLTRWMLTRYGAAPAIAIWASAAIMVLLVVLFSANPHVPVIGVMPWVAIALIVSRGLAYGMARPGARKPVHARAAQRTLQGQECRRHGGVALRRPVGGVVDEWTARARHRGCRFRRLQRDGRCGRGRARLAPGAACRGEGRGDTGRGGGAMTGLLNAWRAREDHFAA